MTNDDDEDDGATHGDGVSTARFKNYKPSVFEARGLAKSDTTGWREKMQMSKVKFDDAAKLRYLEHLAKTGRKGHAAAAAGVCPNCVNEHRKKDPTFNEAVEIAMQMYADDVHALAVKLMNGVDEPIIGGKDKDEIVGYKRVYATNLVSMELKRTNPEYKERSEVDLKGTGAGALVVPAGLTPAEWLLQAQAHNARHEKEPGADE